MNILKAGNTVSKIQRREENVISIELTSNQKRLWFLEKLYPDSAAYSVPQAYVLEGNLDNVLLENSINKVVEHHEVLRTIFYEEEGIPKRRVLPFRRGKLKIIDLSEIDDELKVLKRVNEYCKKPINLNTEFAFQFYLFSVNNNRNILLLNFHHIIFDG